MMSFTWTPMVSIPWLIVIGLALIVPISLMVMAQQRGSVLRLLGAAMLVVALGNPSIVVEDREPLKDVVALVIDHSGSQSLSVRPAQTDLAVAEVKKRLSALAGVEVRVIDVKDSGDEGTRAFEALQKGLSDVAPERMGGALLISDGLVDDVPKSLDALGFHAPVHALITGYQGERDRRIELVDTPQFGLVGKEQFIRLRVSDPGSDEPVQVSVRRDGVVIAGGRAMPGKLLSIPVLIDHGGPNVVEIEAEAAPGELTTLNNKAVLTIEGIRDRLKVLLVSGVPHPGERTWRNMLKSDANVDLVHFTILRPPEKQDGTPISELFLIVMPIWRFYRQPILAILFLMFEMAVRC